MKKLIIILGVLGAAFSAIFVRFSNADANALAFYRMLFAVLLLCPAFLTKCRSEWKQLKPGQFVLCMISGAFLGMHFSFYFESLSYISIASAVVLVDMEVFFVAVGGFIFAKEKISWRGCIGILTAFFGTFIVTFTDAGGGHTMLKGDLIALAGAVCAAVYTLIGKRCRRHMSTMLYTGIVYFFAGITILGKMLISDIPLTGYSAYNYLAALGLAVFCTLLGHSIYSWGLRYEKAAFISTAKLLEPVFATVLGVLFFREIPGMATVIGGIIVIVGIVYYIQKG